MSGLTESGFSKKTLDQIKADIDAAVLAIFGQANVAPDSTFGQIIGIFAEVASDLWDLAEFVYYSQSPNSAIGVALDNVAELNNLIRLAATKSSAICVLEGDEATVVPAGTQLRQSSTTELFETTEAVTISENTVLKAVVSVNTESDDPYRLSLANDTGGQSYQSNDALTIDILNTLRDAINGGTIGTATVDITTEQLTILSANEYSIDIEILTSNLDLDEIWTPVTVDAVEAGKLAVPANTIDTVETPVSGLDAVDNLLAGTEGRNTETDDEFRLRRIQSLRVVGAATVPSIEARILQEVDEVTAVTVRDNREDIEVDSRPPHSFEVIVSFPEGDTVVEQAIADKIWEVGGAGIETHGDITKTVIDSSGDSHAIKFSRPIDRYVHIEVEISLYDEEIFPSDGIDAIKLALQDYGNTLGAGDDVIRQRFYGAIYSISGIENIELYEHDDTTNPGDTPSFTTNNLVMTDNQIPRFNIDRIDVTII